MTPNYPIRTAGLVLLACALGSAKAKDEDELELRSDQSISLDERPDHIALSSDESTIVTVSGTLITTIDRTTKSRKQWKDARRIVDLAITAEGRLLAVATGDTNINVYESRTGKLTQQVHRRDALSFLRTDNQLKVSFFPAGGKLTSTGESRRLYLSDVKTGGWDYITFVKLRACTPLVSPDGKFVAIFGPPEEYEQAGQLLMFKIRRGFQPLWTSFHSGQQAATHAAFSPQAERIASCGAGDGVRIWHVKSGKQLAHLQMKSDMPLLGVSFANDGKMILMAAPNELQLREINSDKILVSYALKKPIKAFSASQNGDNFITSGDDAELQVWAIDKK